ncbi:hypothetical protein AOZ06_31400 [Kibdelosporangium phytohabitans]|uniref:Uncharacterized protein n=1 Tax=Kibdelosporangium phytohabitans TaxID=860235 RepID=A0A0N9I409_9PSEU|nr:hypothetical protein AOZ06_31400 [Kibdelosporangium phytohabitans]
MSRNSFSIRRLKAASRTALAPNQIRAIRRMPTRSATAPAMSSPITAPTLSTSSNVTDVDSGYPAVRINCGSHVLSP